MSKFFLHTFGCRCNQADSAAMRASLQRDSMTEAARHRDAGLIVVNTCTVTQRTDQQVRQAVRKFHRENPAARIVVTGCYAERDPQGVSAIPGVSLVVGNAERARLADILAHEQDSSGVRVFHGPLEEMRNLPIADPAAGGGKTRPFLKLQDGCDARCSYCVVPFVRGPGRSTAPEETVRMIRDLVEHGYQEIVLTGVNLGTYGRKLADRTSLVDLLRSILEIPHLGRLRLSSIEPMRFDRGIVRLAAGNRAFARHFHIPLQSGSDRILRSMRRPYTAARFRDLLDFIADQLPEVGLGTDVMAGFPGETQADFQATCDLIRKSPLSYLHVFPFSARPGTEASSMGDQIPPGTIRERVQILRALSQEKSQAFRSRLVGRSLPAITLAKEEQAGSSVVLTDNYIHVLVAGLQVPPNRLVTVSIVEARAESTTAVLECGLPAS